MELGVRSEPSVEKGGRWGAAGIGDGASLKQAPAPPRDEDLEIGREVLARHCGSCHTPGLLTTSSRALTVFSLADPDWTVRMTDGQICEAAQRLRKSSKVATEEAAAFATAAEAILRRRGSPACER